MRLDAFDYDLPPACIAQHPPEKRSASRLMVVDRDTGAVADARFRDFAGYLDPGDLLVLNRSRVIPARLLVRRRSGGRVELLVTRLAGGRHFVAMANPLRKLRPGDALQPDGGGFMCRIVARTGEREVLVEIASEGTAEEVLDRYGRMPLPPYIQRRDEPSDRERYQTVFAEEAGSVAAPTAGLHFDDDTFAALDRRGVERCFVVLHVGPGTFLPLVDETVEENTLHPEPYTVSAETIRLVMETKARGGRVVAVGTTTTRVLETLAREGRFDGNGAGEECRGETRLFIFPGFPFRVIDGLVTNFHLPKSSLLLLVGAFLGREKTLACYRRAIDNQYRFYSYGDVMFVR